MAKSGLLFGTVALAFATLSPAMAQNPQERAILEQQCTGDYLRLCNMYEPDSPQVEQCFKAKTAELSPNCRSAITAFTGKGSGKRR